MKFEQIVGNIIARRSDKTILQYVALSRPMLVDQLSQGISANISTKLHKKTSRHRGSTCQPGHVFNMFNNLRHVLR